MTNAMVFTNGEIIIITLCLMNLILGAYCMAKLK